MEVLQAVITDTDDITSWGMEWFRARAQAADPGDGALNAHAEAAMRNAAEFA
jgi:hypothetical protein